MSATVAVRVMLVFALVAAAPRVAGAQTSTPSSAPDSTSDISARLTDHESGMPIQGAIVRLVSGVGRAEHVRTRLTNQDGRFFFSKLPGGTYSLQAGGMGYRDLSDSLSIPSGKRLELRLQLSSSPIQLQPVLVVVKSRAQRRGPVPGLEARERRGLGTIITREKISEENPFVVSDLFRTVPGVRVVPDRDLGYDLELRGGCKPAIWVDGTRTSADDIDLVLHPADLQAVEIYQASEIPVRFATNRCGVVLFWTRPQESVHGKAGPLWKKLLIPAVVLAVVILRAY